MKGLEVAKRIVCLLRQFGVKDAVCSPGSRNAPLLVAFDTEVTIRKQVIVDERSAAFVALGIAQVSGRPVALVCTSGSALLNYAPAISEAYYRNISLIVISADRPEKWIDQEDSQTIRQPGALANIVNTSVDIPVVKDFDYLNIVDRKICDALHSAIYPIKGPVHINVQFENPLPSENIDAEEPRYIDLLVNEENLPRKTYIELAKYVSNKRIMLVCGYHQPDNKLNRAVKSFETLPNVIIVSEVVSNIHRVHQLPDFEKIQKPDIIINVGGALVSSEIKNYIRHLDKVEVWKVGYTRNVIDTFQHLTKRIETNPARFLTMLAAHMRKSNVSAEYQFSTDLIKPVLPNSFEQEAIDYIVNNLDARTNLILSNGMTIRHTQKFMHKMPHACFCNRGVAGIDGNTSTAIGSALAYSGPTLLISGDTSFLYDLSALSLRKLIPNSFRMIVISNGGGNIFREIRTTSNLSQRERYFCTELNLPLEKLCETYAIHYYHAIDSASLKTAFNSLLKDKAPSLLLCETYMAR